MSLEAQIDASIAAVNNWEDRTGIGAKYLIWFGNILTQKSLSDFDDLIDYYRTNSKWKNVAHIKKQTEIVGYKSTTIDTAVKGFLADQTMFTNYALPKTDTTNNYFEIGYPYVLHGYRWAKELRYETDKWDAVSGYNGLHRVYANEGHAFYRCNPDTGEGDVYWGGTDTRIYEVNHLANCFWNFYDDNEINDALTNFEDLYTELHNTHWKTDHFTYCATDSSLGWVWDAHEFVEVFGKMEARGLNPSNFDRLSTHISNGNLASYWNSPHFTCGTNYHVVVHNNDSNNQRKLSGTLIQVAAMWQMWNRMTTSDKGKFRDMLMGTGSAHAAGWECLLEADHGLFDSGTDRFKNDSDDANTSDGGTARGATLLFLLGIAPSSTDSTAGRLAFPLRTVTLGGLEVVDPHCFQWDGDNDRIRIAVFKGNLTFMYGTENVSYNFPRNGIYDVYFSSDYNSIIKVTQHANLPFEWYLDKPTSAAASDPTVHDNWNKIINKFKSAGMSATVTWRKLTLGVDPDTTTGWFRKYYAESSIDVIIQPKNVAWINVHAGTFATLSYEMYTSSQVEDGDQIVYNNRYYEVRNTLPVFMGENLLCRKCELIYLPFEGEA